MEYGITAFPIDEKRLASEMGFFLVRYSDLTEKDKTLIQDIIQTGVHICQKKKSGPVFIIVYNDRAEPGRIKLTILHEIGHILLGHGSNPTRIQETEADYFAKQMAAPRCILKLRGHTTTTKIHHYYGLSFEASEWTAVTLERVIAKYGDTILENDREYIEWVRRCSNDT